MIIGEKGTGCRKSVNTTLKSETKIKEQEDENVINETVIFNFFFPNRIDEGEPISHKGNDDG